MPTLKRVFTLRLEDYIFDKIEYLAQKDHRSMTNYIENVLLEHIAEKEKEIGEIPILASDDN